MSEGSRMESRITELEIKISYAEDLVDELNGTVFRQQAGDGGRDVFGADIGKTWQVGKVE